MSLLNSRLRVLIGGASALTLSACAAVGPDFVAPRPPAGHAADGYAMAGDPAASGVRLDPQVRAAGPWWTAFGSQELDQVVRMALADSPTIAEADAVLARVRAEATAAHGAQRPQVDAAASAQRERINTQSFGFTGFPSPTISLYSVGAAVSYDIDLFGGRRRASEAAQARVEAAQRRADAAYLTLSANVALQAVRIAGLRAEMRAVDAIVADDRRVLDIVKRAEAVGGQSPAASSGAQAQLAEDLTLLPPLQRQVDAARHQLALLVGKSPAEWTAPDFDMDLLKAPSDTPISLPSALVRARPDILAAEADLHAATAGVGVAVANLYPNIRLSAGLTQSTVTPEDLFGGDASGWNLLAGLTAPVFHGGALKAQRDAAQADVRASLARYRQTVLRAFVQVSDVLAALGSDDQSVAAYAHSSAVAQGAANDAQAAYQLGGGALMQVVDAQRQLSRARRDLIEAQALRYADLVELYAATATDWRAPGG